MLWTYTLLLPMQDNVNLLPMSKKNYKLCCLWKWRCQMWCLNLSWICCWCYNCFSACCNRKQRNCKCDSCLSSINCSLTNWCYFYDKKSHYCKYFYGCNNCCCNISYCNFRWPFPSCFKNILLLHLCNFIFVYLDLWKLHFSWRICMVYNWLWIYVTYNYSLIAF